MLNTVENVESKLQDFFNRIKYNDQLKYREVGCVVLSFSKNIILISKLCEICNVLTKIRYFSMELEQTPTEISSN